MCFHGFLREEEGEREKHQCISDIRDTSTDGLLPIGVGDVIMPRIELETLP